MTINDYKINSIGQRLLFAFMFFVPIFFAANINLGHATLRVAQEQMFQMGALVLYAVVLLQNIYLALFLLLGVILYIAHDYSGGNVLTNIFYGCLIYQVSYQVINRDNVEKAFKVVLWLCALNLGLMILQNMGHDPIFVDLTRPSDVMNNIGFMGLKCFLGMLFAIALPFALYFNPWVAVMFLIPIGLSESSICVISACISFSIYLWFRLSDNHKKLFVGGLLILGILAAVYTVNDSKANMMTDRFNLWKITLRDAFKKPVSGWGMDSFRNISSNGTKDFNYFKNPADNSSVHGVYMPESQAYLMPKNITKPDQWDNPHNEYVQLLFEFGIFGFAILGFLARDIYRRFDRYSAALTPLFLFFIAFAVVSLTQFPAHVVRIGVFLPIMLGFYYKLTDENLGVI